MEHMLVLAASQTSWPDVVMYGLSIIPIAIMYYFLFRD